MKSLATNWIRKLSDKTLPIPEFMYFPFNDRGGCYYSPDEYNEVYDVDGKPHSMKYGVIVIASKHVDVESSIIAHEWRHHMQQYNGMEYDEPKCTSKQVGNGDADNYDDMVRQYFSTSKAEMDALRFEYKHVKFCGSYEPWEEILYDFVEDLRIKPIISYANKSFTNK